ncbi:hypothetical protein M6B38_280390 [Iris pallida]|uniref:Uncharacterized protein n=1 Tax=Iris pallida TaxID=29817 RepID=A0AAX6I0N7_IRIPA|nr:hypothetical protein M6B38_280390 [Iris pallida]
MFRSNGNIGRGVRGGDRGGGDGSEPTGSSAAGGARRSTLRRFSFLEMRTPLLVAVVRGGFHNLVGGKSWRRALPELGLEDIRITLLLGDDGGGGFAGSSGAERLLFAPHLLALSKMTGPAASRRRVLACSTSSLEKVDIVGWCS